jgi:hypothetical protein
LERIEERFQSSLSLAERNLLDLQTGTVFPGQLDLSLTCYDHEMRVSEEIRRTWRAEQDWGRTGTGHGENVWWSLGY